MKITVIGAGGVRTPLIVESILKRQERLGIDKLALMDIDARRLDIIGALTAPLEANTKSRLEITRTIDSQTALDGADFVITTFRVGGIESRVIDERVPLKFGVLGQETTGPGGYAMGMRTIPVLLDYVDLARRLCPDAWLINFANPAGMLTEALTRVGGWERAVGICDAPSSMQRVAAAVIGKPADQVFLDYFGLNHLGWIRSIVHNFKNYLPDLIKMIFNGGQIPGLPFDPELIGALGMIPNEYLYYYYYDKQAVENITRSGQTRGEQISNLNLELFSQLQGLMEAGRQEDMQSCYHRYLDQRGSTYMVSETGTSHEGTAHELEDAFQQAFEGEGYAGVALDLMEALTGVHPRTMILNIPNMGAVHGMGEAEVVEIPASVSAGSIRPLAVGEIPTHAQGLMKEVKAYECLTIEAAVEGSYSKALLALTIHPLVRDHILARKILDGYIQQHGKYFPVLT